MLNDQDPTVSGNFGSSADALDSDNRRTDQRHLSVFRVGKLVTAAGHELCLVRNISSGGLMAHVYSTHEPHERVEIELKAGGSVAGTIVWARDRKIGVQFDEKVEVSEVLAPQQHKTDPDFVVRTPRLDIHRRGRIRIGAQYQLIELHDISQGGAKISPAGDAQADDEVILLLEGLPPLTGIVRWRQDDTAGITFKTSIPFEQLAAWVPENR